MLYWALKVYRVYLDMIVIRDIFLFGVLWSEFVEYISILVIYIKLNGGKFKVCTIDIR